MCGKRFTFLYTSSYEHVRYNVLGPWVKSLTSVQNKIFTIIFVVKSLNNFGWNNVCPAS